MPKLLSRSKHEEFKLNLALQIKDQRKEQQKQKKLHHCKHAFPASTVPASSALFHIQPLFSLQLHAFVVLLQFLVFSYFNPCNSFNFSFFL